MPREDAWVVFVPLPTDDGVTGITVPLPTGDGVIGVFVPLPTDYGVIGIAVPLPTGDGVTGVFVPLPPDDGAVGGFVLLPTDDGVTGIAVPLAREDGAVGVFVPLPKVDVRSAVLPVAVVGVGCTVAILPGDEALAVVGVPFDDVPGGDTVPTPMEENRHCLEPRQQHLDMHGLLGHFNEACSFGLEINIPVIQKTWTA